MNKNFLIVALVLSTIGILALVYFFFFTGTPSITVAPAGSTGLPVAGQIPSSGGTPDSGLTTATGTPSSSPVAISPRLVQISSGPIVPGEAITTIPVPKNAPASSTPDVAVTFVERTSGNVFSYLVSKNSLTRTNNKTIPGIESATWFPDASVALVRYLSGADLSTINTYALASATSTGFFMPQNLSDIDVSVSGILSISSGVNGSVVSLSRLNGTNTSSVFTTPLTSIRASFAGKSNYLVFSKPSASLSGNAFFVDGNGRFSRLAGPLNGLVALASHSGKWVLVSYVQGGAMRMELVNTSTMEVLGLPVATIADKCAWTPDDSSIYCGVPVNPNTTYSYPDDWYQGAVSLSDRIWRIDVTGHYAQLVLDFPQFKRGDLDALSLTVDPTNTELVFMNKIDGSLWGYSL